MILPQTNLQLYQTLSDVGYDRNSLRDCKAAYEISQSLFGSCFRPCGKPFVSHLLGTAGALAMWRQPFHSVIAGLLHSVYLFGDFKDGEKGPSDRRRKWLQSKIGGEAEGLIHRYSTSKWANDGNKDLHEQAKQNQSVREIFILKLADLYDEVADGGILLAPKKHYPFGLLTDPEEEQALVAAIADLIGSHAADAFSDSLGDLDKMSQWTDDLVSERTSFYRLESGVQELRRGRVNRRIVKLYSKIKKKSRAA
ncbi:MAG: DUF6817 domain-containing protein [Rubripirellula sp.]